MTDSALREAAVATPPVSPPPPRPRRRSNRRGGSLGSRVGLYILLVVIALVYIYPFLVQVSTSFKTESEAAADPISLIPQTWSFAAYERLFAHSDFPLWFANSAIVTICVTIGRVFFV